MVADTRQEITLSGLIFVRLKFKVHATELKTHSLAITSTFAAHAAVLVLPHRACMIGPTF